MVWVQQKKLIWISCVEMAFQTLLEIFVYVLVDLEKRLFLNQQLE